VLGTGPIAGGLTLGCATLNGFSLSGGSSPALSKALARGATPCQIAPKPSGQFRPFAGIGAAPGQHGAAAA
jgi:hypothetical protein